MIVKEYELNYSREREQWEIWEIKKVLRGLSNKCIFSGKKKECQEKLRKIKKGTKK